MGQALAELLIPIPHGGPLPFLLHPPLQHLAERTRYFAASAALEYLTRHVADELVHQFVRVLNNLQ